MPKPSDIQPLIECSAVSLQNAERQLKAAIEINTNPLVDAFLQAVKTCLDAHHASANEVLKARNIKLQGGPGSGK